MLDNLRESASQSPFFQEGQKPPEEEPTPDQKPASSRKFLGMTPLQRFVIASIFFMMVCVFGSFILIASQKIWLGG